MDALVTCMYVHQESLVVECSKLAFRHHQVATGASEASTAAKN